jgi:ATP-binding cassette subfamily C (CFTR/MRP) protein 1
VYWVVSATVVIANVSLYMLCIILPLLVLYYFIQKYYRRSCVELQRLDALSRSPIQGHFQESLQGTATIRAYGQQARFVAISDLRVDTNQTALFSFTVASVCIHYSIITFMLYNTQFSLSVCS